jgi:peptidoglycan hydrolase CwlO-like protein
MTDNRINNNQLLKPIMELVAGQAKVTEKVEGIKEEIGEVKEKISSIETKLEAHLVGPEKNGKKINRRKLSLFQKIMIFIAIATFLGGCTIGKYILDDMYKYIDNKYKQSQSE